MKVKRTIRPIRGPIDVAPLVDVVLLLLVFFVLNSSFVLQPGIQVTPPKSVFDRGVRDSRYIVTITANDPPIYFFNDQKMEVENLGERFEQLANDEGDVTVVIRADEAVSHGVVVEVMQSAVQQGLPVVLATQLEGAE